MLWGLCMEAERIGEESRIVKEHSDRLAVNYDGERKMGGQLDLIKPLAEKWMEEQTVPTGNVGRSNYHS